MPAKFKSEEVRDALAKRLMTLANHMQRAWDQGHDGRIVVDDNMIGDIQAAAGVVALAEVEKR